MNKKDLLLLLNKFPNIDQSKWIKTIDNLLEEINNNKCTLEVQNGNLYRCVRVATVECYYVNNQGQRFKLMESKQIFKNGNELKRGFYHVSEKLLPYETPVEGAIRGLKEELQIIISPKQFK